MIGAMFILALGSYAFVVEMIRARQAPFTGYVPTAPVGVLRLVLAGMALVSLLAATIMSRNIAARRAAGPAAPRFLTANVVAMAMCESIAMYGLVLFLLAGQRADFYGFAALALLAFAWHFPRRSQWEEWAQQA
jgi:F0F1-type ATP synthase membrane subunit c/vacuolar-type H+-ATPase subunit K